MKSIQNWLSSIRGKSSTGSSNSSAPLRRRSRRDTEAQRTRVFFLSMAAVAALIVVILGGGALYEYVFKPNAVLAEVNGHEISRRDYWKYQSVVLYRQARTYESFAMQTTGQQQQQFMQFAAAFDAQRQNIWGSTDVSNATLQQMIDDRLYLDGASAMGIDITDEMVSQFALNEFAPPDAPLQTPIPSPTLIPERAAMATETAAALATEQALDFGTPVDTAPIATPAATPVVGATPIASPVTDAQPGVATPDLMNSLASANADSCSSRMQSSDWLICRRMTTSGYGPGRKWLASSSMRN